MNNIRRPRESAGFTLIELLVVTAILGVLGVIASNLFVSSIAARAPAAAIPNPGIPAPDAPLTAAELLVRLAGVAVLLFGAGFMYTAELNKPGQLDRFRLPHFLLLALTYCLFFVAFAVLHNHEVTAWLAVGIAAALSYPLVTLHVATVVNARFAILFALPLVALTTGIVVTGVYGAELRGFIYLGMAAFVIAFLTISHPRLAARKERRDETQQQRFREQANELILEADPALAMIAEAKTLLHRADVDEHEGMRRWVEQRLEATQRTVDTFERMRGEFETMSSTANATRRREACHRGIDLACELQLRLPQACVSLDEAMRNLATQRQRHAAVSTPPRAPGHDHCLACGHTAAENDRFCAHCGTPSAVRRQCPRCDTVLHLPRHLLMQGEFAELPTTHCHGCGERHADAG